MTYKLNGIQLNEFFARVASDKKLYLPVDTENGARFEEWTEGKTLSSKLNTVRSAKDFFFPQVQGIVDFKLEGKNIEVIDRREEVKNFVVFGVRACDAAAFAVLDRVFLSEPVDSFYAEKRNAATVITLACSNPEETCFCSSFGIDASAPGGDVEARLVEDALYLSPLTEKGEAFVESIKDLLVSADDAVVEADKALIKAKIAKLPLASLKPADLRDKQLETFESEAWAELSQSCLGCGSCTFVCPTCQCYDIRDFDTGHEVKRFRCWDSCMYSDFTLMAAENPRHTQLERFRQRFMHKLVYFPMNNDGVYGCVGCGRCLKKCPVSLNIVKVMKRIGGVKNEQ